MQLKHCSACGGGPWPPQCFYKAGKRKDGSIRRDRKCKNCRKRINADYSANSHHYQREYDQVRYRRPEMKALMGALHKQYMQTPAGKAARRRKTRAWRVTHPELYAAQKQRAAAALRAKRAASRASATPSHTSDEPAHTAG